MANQKIQLKSVNGNKLFPRTSINNIVGEDTEPAKSRQRTYRASWMT